MIIIGAQQIEETTPVRECFSSYPYFSIEDPVLRGQYASLTAAQWKNSYPKAILDEVQKEPVPIENIKSVYDQCK